MYGSILIYHVAISIKVNFNMNATLLFSHFVQSDPTFFPIFGKSELFLLLFFCIYVGMYLNVLLIIVILGGLKSVAYIQDELLIRKLSFWVCI